MNSVRERPMDANVLGMSEIDRYRLGLATDDAWRASQELGWITENRVLKYCLLISAFLFISYWGFACNP
jgi:hypothetical protein